MFRSRDLTLLYELVGNCTVASPFIHCIASRTTFATWKSISKFDNGPSLSPNICPYSQAGSVNTRESFFADICIFVDTLVVFEVFGSSIRLLWARLEGCYMYATALSFCDPRISKYLPIHDNNCSPAYSIYNRLLAIFTSGN